MDESLDKSNTNISKNDIREGIMDFEAKIKSIEGHFEGDSFECPLKHSFTDGIYVREIYIPAGMYVVGKIHKHGHPNFLLSGEVKVITEAGEEVLIGPKSIISPPGTKRALFAITDLVWVTVHHNPTNTQDLKELEDIVIAENYKEYSKFISKKNGVISGIKNKLIKFLTK